MASLKVLHIPICNVKEDPALQPGGWGERKILVTRLIPSSEFEATSQLWNPPSSAHRCPVLPTVDTEMSYFTQEARQERHWHRSATEIYEVLEGVMQVEVEGMHHHLEVGDTLVILPGAAHQVLSGEDHFFAKVISVNCLGPEDKYTF